MPVGLEETDPVPATLICSVGLLKFAVIVVLPVKVKVQGPVALLQFAVKPLPFPLLQPENSDAPSGVASTETAVPTG
jgi:hypothetical protein